MGWFVEFFRNPKRALRRAWSTWKYRGQDGYDAARFWHDRLKTHGQNLKGVGYTKLSHAENLENYLAAKETFLTYCEQEKVDFKRVRMLDVGCGVGFYTQVFLEAGGTRYLGLDITDTLFGSLKEKFPQYEFRKLDISTEDLDGQFDLVVMIDVTQHITSDVKFHHAMQNIRRCLSPKGVFLVTSWLQTGVRERFFERSRERSTYEQEFPDHPLGKPVPFRDKFLFSIRPPQARASAE